MPVEPPAYQSVRCGGQSSPPALGPLCHHKEPTTLRELNGRWVEDGLTAALGRRSCCKRLSTLPRGAPLLQIHVPPLRNATAPHVSAG